MYARATGPRDQWHHPPSNTTPLCRTDGSNPLEIDFQRSRTPPDVEGTRLPLAATQSTDTAPRQRRHPAREVPLSRHRREAPTELVPARHPRSELQPVSCAHSVRSDLSPTASAEATRCTNCAGRRHLHRQPGNTPRREAAGPIPESGSKPRSRQAREPAIRSSTTEASRSLAGVERAQLVLGLADRIALAPEHVAGGHCSTSRGLRRLLLLCVASPPRRGHAVSPAECAAEGGL
jgi:hypothetical protein